MNVGYIYDINTSDFIGLVASNSEGVAYITNDNALNSILDIILNKDKLPITTVNNNEFVKEEIGLYDNGYIHALSYYLPDKFDIKKLKYIDKDLSELNNIYMEENNLDKES